MPACESLRFLNAKDNICNQIMLWENEEEIKLRGSKENRTGEKEREKGVKNDCVNVWIFTMEHSNFFILKTEESIVGKFIMHVSKSNFTDYCCLTKNIVNLKRILYEKKL